MTTKREDDPSTTSMAYNAISPSWTKIQTVLDGTEALRAAGETYLPQHERETDRAYRERRETATLLNMTKLTLGSWVGRPFSRPVMVDEDVPEVVRGWLEDVDLQGNNVTVFARQWFREGLAKEWAGVLVDSPLPDRELQTRADDRQAGIRPYMAFVRPEDTLFMETRVVDGVDVLTHLRIYECEVVRVGFAEARVERIRVYDRVFPEDANPEGLPEGVSFRVFRLRREANSKKEVWVLETPSIPMAIDRVPFVLFHATGEDKPALEDLADLNINWFQSNSDQNVALTVARFPILAGTGLEAEETILTVGPKRGLTSENPEAKFYYVEHEGKAIAAGRQQLADLESHMAHYGAEFLRERSGGETATARALDSAEATSPLQDAAVRFSDALTTAVHLMGEWAGLEFDGKVSVHTEFKGTSMGPGDLDALDKARARGEISRSAYLETLKEKGVLSSDFDPKEDAERLDEEAVSAPPTGAQLPLLPGQVDVDPEAEE